MGSGRYDKRLKALETTTGGKGKFYLVYPQWEPQVIDAGPDDKFMVTEWVSSERDDNGGAQLSAPYLRLSDPLPDDVEELLADGFVNGKNTYHRWNPVTREFITPYGLRRAALPKEAGS